MNTIFTKIGSVVVGILMATGILHPVQAPQAPAQTPAEQAPAAQQLGAFNPSGGGTYFIRSSAGTSDTSITLSSFKEPISNTPYTMSYLNTGIAYGTLEPQTPTRTEFISFTGITQNSDGSALLTGVSRGLSRTPAGQSCTASTTLASRHPGQGIFILSDSPCLFAEYAVKRNDETVTGSWTFSDPTAAQNPATKNYVDTHINGGTVSTDKVTVAGTAGESFNTGQIVYFNTFDGKWYKASATNASTTQNVQIGIAQGAGANNVSVTNGIIVFGLDSTTQGTGLVSGNRLYLSNTAGATSTVPGTNYLALGAARSTSAFYLNTRMDTSTSTNATSTNMFVSGTCDGCVHTTVTEFTTSGLWRKPQVADGTNKVSHVMIIAVGAGGGGGAGCACTGDLAGSGGGGGAVNIKYFEASKLPAVVWVQVGTSTTPASGTASGVVPSSGGNGTASFVGTSTSANFVYAGGGGGGWANRNGGFGGAGGSWFGSVTLATSSPFSASTTAISGQGVEGGIFGHPAEWGGGSGGGFASSTSPSGGCSLYGAGGGGGTEVGAAANSGSGGGTGCYSTGGGAAGNQSTGVAGSSATTTNATYGGTGGSAGTSQGNNITNGTAGGDGGYPGGGGGGGGACDPSGSCTGGAGGRGAPGWVRIIAW
jgi:hypothetical protein